MIDDVFGTHVDRVGSCKVVNQAVARDDAQVPDERQQPAIEIERV